MDIAAQQPRHCKKLFDCQKHGSRVAGCLERASQAGLSWPLPESLDDVALEQLLYPPVVVSEAVRAMPQWPLLQKELKRKGVTLALLWDEYKAGQPNGYHYSQFCKLYREFTSQVDCCMRQSHIAGEKLFVDYCGQTVPLTSPETGIVKQCQVFVAVMGASSYTYAEATLSQSLPDWLGSHVRAFIFLGGLPGIVVPDNLRSAVSKPCRYEPKLNPSYAELADHYNVAVIPARVRKPRDKAKAEAGVQLVQRWILAVLRNRTFFSLDELNQAIAELLTRLNAKPFRKISGSRESLFAELDKPALAPLPANHYQYADWLPVRLGFNYHVQIDDHFECAGSGFQVVKFRTNSGLTILNSKVAAFPVYNQATTLISPTTSSQDHADPHLPVRPPFSLPTGNNTPVPFLSGATLLGVYRTWNKSAANPSGRFIFAPLSWSIEQLLTFKIDKICPRPAEFSLRFPKSDRLLASS